MKKNVLIIPLLCWSCHATSQSSASSSSEPVQKSVPGKVLTIDSSSIAGHYAIQIQADTMRYTIYSRKIDHACQNMLIGHSYFFTLLAIEYPPLLVNGKEVKQMGNALFQEQTKNYSAVAVQKRESLDDRLYQVTNVKGLCFDNTSPIQRAVKKTAAPY